MQDFLDSHLNVSWLRPESALWDAIASRVVSQVQIVSPSLDLGSGNGIFSFITAGGVFSEHYDWYRNAGPLGFWENHDIYDTFHFPVEKGYIARNPDYAIDVALDGKMNLLRQAAGLDFYGLTVGADANLQLPFADNSFETVFSNILYWLNSPDSSLAEVRRVLRPGGRALLCLQDHKFRQYCVSYQWSESGSEVLRLLNRGRSESSKWTISHAELETLARRQGFKETLHSYYLSPLTLRIWDIGLRPLSAVLIRMIGLLDEKDRLSIKAEWIDTVRPFLKELYDLDRQSGQQGGYHFICLEKV